MTEFKPTDDITIYGVTFNGVADLIEHTKSHEPKDGVWVGADRKLYPCFDSSDWLYEDRYYWNFVFAKSEDELKEKLKKVKDEEPRMLDYDKSGIVAPMVYWGGEDRYPMEFEPAVLDIYTLSIDHTVPEVGPDSIVYNNDSDDTIEEPIFNLPEQPDVVIDEDPFKDIDYIDESTITDNELRMLGLSREGEESKK